MSDKEGGAKVSPREDGAGTRLERLHWGRLHRCVLGNLDNPFHPQPQCSHLEMEVKQRQDGEGCDNSMRWPGGGLVWGRAKLGWHSVEQ